MSGHNCCHNWLRSFPPFSLLASPCLNSNVLPHLNAVFLCDSIGRTTLKRMENFRYLFSLFKSNAFSVSIILLSPYFCKSTILRQTSLKALLTPLTIQRNSVYIFLAVNEKLKFPLRNSQNSLLTS